MFTCFHTAVRAAADRADIPIFVSQSVNGLSDFMANSAKGTITWEELRIHVDEGDIWIAINGRVYNISNWSKLHPGGELVLMHAAGKDASSAFNAYHPTWVADKFLNSYCIGQIGHTRAKRTKARPDLFDTV
jgi:cytochrome b involved in lipid metabolism